MDERDVIGEMIETHDGALYKGYERNHWKGNHILRSILLLNTPVRTWAHKTPGLRIGLNIIRRAVIRILD